MSLGRHSQRQAPRGQKVVVEKRLRAEQKADGEDERNARGKAGRIAPATNRGHDRRRRADAGSDQQVQLNVEAQLQPCGEMLIASESARRFTAEPPSRRLCRNARGSQKKNGRITIADVNPTIASPRAARALIPRLWHNQREDRRSENHVLLFRQQEPKHDRAPMCRYPRTARENACAKRQQHQHLRLGSTRCSALQEDSRAETTTTILHKNETRLGRAKAINAPAISSAIRFEYRTSPSRYPGIASSRLIGR